LNTQNIIQQIYINSINLSFVKIRGRTAVIILIIVLLISFILVENLRQILPEPVIGEISDWNVDYENSDEAYTVISAKINISYPRKQFIGFLNNTTRLIIPTDRFVDGEIYYKSKSDGKRRIGDVSFIPPWEEKDKVFSESISGEPERKVERVFELKPGTSITPRIYFRLYNCEIPFIWRDQLKNKEGEILVNISFTFEILNTTIKILYPGIWREDISLDIIDRLNDALESADLNERFLEKNIFNTKITLNVIKHAREIFLESRIENPFFDHRCIIWAIYLLDKLYNSEVSSDITVFNCNLSLNKSTRLNFFYKKYFPQELQIDLDNLSIIKIFLEPYEEKHRLFGDWWKEKRFNMTLKIDNTLLDDCIYRHIANKEKSVVSIYIPGNVGYENISINFSTNISSMLPDILLKINKTILEGFKEFLIYIQILITAGVTGLTVFLIYDYLYNHRSKKK